MKNVPGKEIKKLFCQSGSQHFDLGKVLKREETIGKLSLNADKR
jgi:hypothetical protein